MECNLGFSGCWIGAIGILGPGGEGGSGSGSVFEG